MNVADVVEALADRGITLSYPAVAAWFNGHRGGRWKVNELKALLEVLQTDLDQLLNGEAELVEEKVPAATARAMKDLSAEQQQAVFAMVKSMKIDK